MNLDDLQALVWLAQHGTIQGIVRAEGIPRTTLKRRLQRLDASLGVETVIQRNDGLGLTPVGIVLVEQGKELLRRRKRLVRSAQKAQQPVAFRVLVDAGVPSMSLAFTLRTVSDLFPDTKMEVCLQSDPMVHHLDDFDAVVCWGEIPAPGFGFTRVLARIAISAQASPEYLARNGRPSALEDLDRHVILGLSDSEDRWPLRDGGVLHVRPKHRLSDRYILGCAVAAGVGIALVPVGGPGVHPALEVLEPVLPEIIGGDIPLRIFLPERVRPGSVHAEVLSKIEALVMQFRLE